MKDLLAWFGLKGFPFDKNLKTQDVFETEPLKEALARLITLSAGAASCF